MKRAALLVTYNEQTCEGLSSSLQSANYEVQLARNARNAREGFDQSFGTHCDLMLVDLDWCAANGWDAFELLEEVGGGRPFLPVILITGRSGLSERAQSCGASALAETPLDVPALLATAEALVAESQADRQDRVCNHRADFRHLPPKEPDFRELIRRRTTTPYVYSPPPSRWGLNE